MKIYLVQHGEALSAERDPDRALSAQGRSDIERTAAFLKAAGVRVTRVLESGKLRARQSAEILAAAVAPSVTIEVAVGLNPLDDPEPFARQLAARDEDILIVAHLPFLGRLVGRLVVGDRNAVIVAYRPGAMLCLERDDSRWALAWMLQPTLLPPAVSDAC